MASNELTKQQNIFYEHYIKTCNGIEALKKAYPKAVTWSYNAQHVEVNKLLNNPKISLKLAEHNKAVESALQESTKLNKRKILNEIIELQQKCKAQDSQNTVNLQALKLLSQIAGLLSENTTNITVNNNNVVVGEVIDYLDL